MLHLSVSVSGVSSGKRFVADIGFKVRRRESIATVLGLRVSGVRPVVDGGGMVANRRRGDELLLCWIGVSVDVCFSVLVVTMDGSLTQTLLVSVVDNCEQEFGNVQSPELALVRMPAVRRCLL